MGPFALPCPLRTRSGSIRRVGVELEFGGLALADAADAVRAALGGTVRQKSENLYTVETTLGEFEVTYDSSLLRQKQDKGEGVGGALQGAVEGVLEHFGGRVLPLEIGSPPIPADRLDALNRLEKELRDRHAEGTASGFFTAFALHFNPEAVDPNDPECALGTLRAYLLLADWLVRKSDIDLTRCLMPFISPFPEEFARLVIDPAYAPDMNALANDYLFWNPTRNRPLDLLPLLAFALPDLPRRSELAGQKIKPRPTFHYRLPNCSIDEPDWSISDEWERWVLVERLAASPGHLRRLSREYLDWDSSIVGYFADRWVSRLDEEWIHPLRKDPAPAT